jgi:hypothetical protein
MKLLLERKYLKDTYTIGNLYINGEFFCNVLEDKVRIPFIKIPKETAIPYGIYKVIITYSGKFQREMPLLNDVPQYQGIRIHSGNTEVDTEGCLLVGENKVIGKVINSKITFDKLYPILKETFDKGEEITIEIV